MARRGELAQQRLELADAGSRRAAQLRRELGRHQLVDERQAVDQRPVHHAEADQGADSRVVVGLQGRVDRGPVDPGGLREVVDQCRAAGAQRLDRADHRPQVDLARRQRHRHARANQLHPELERQVLGAAALEVLVRVLVAVDEAGDEEPLRQLDDLVGALGGDRSRRLDGGDPVALDQHVERARLEREPVAEQGDGAAQEGATRRHRRSRAAGAATLAGGTRRA